MDKLNIIIAEINKYNSYEDFYSGAHNYIDLTYKRLSERLAAYFSENNKQNIKISDIYNFEEIEKLIYENKDEKIIIFSNFPANLSYKRYKVEDKNGKRGYLADGYDKTLEKYKALLQANKNINLHIITGASEKLISNKDITDISNNNRVIVKRKIEWTEFNMNNYEAYIKTNI